MYRKISAGLVALVLGACSAEAPESAAEPWQLGGPDRMERLIAGAQAEGAEPRETADCPRSALRARSQGRMLKGKSRRRIAFSNA